MGPLYQVMGTVSGGEWRRKPRVEGKERYIIAGVSDRDRPRPNITVQGMFTEVTADNLTADHLNISILYNAPISQYRTVLRNLYVNHPSVDYTNTLLVRQTASTPSLR